MLIQRWIRFLHNHTSIFTKVLVANALIALSGSLLAVIIATRFWRGVVPEPVVEALFVMAGMAISLGVNYGILWVAFRPLFILQATLDRVREGDFSARVPLTGGDPDIARVTETANLMLDRLARHRQAIAAQILRALEGERKRIARELHDETSQSLTSIMVNLEAIEQQLNVQSEELVGRVRLTKDIAQRTLDETRRLMFDLRPSVLDDLGLIPALRWFISQRVQPMGLKVEFTAWVMEQRLPEELETALFRIMQEAITNAVKHARASKLEVRLTWEPGRIVGLVRDDGQGFDPERVAPTNHERGLGLFGMRERASLVGGEIKVDSALGKGTCIWVTIPERVGGQ